MADPNPYHQDPYLQSIVSNLSKAFIDKNPGKTMVDREHAGVLGLQADKLAREAEKRSAIASMFRNLNGRSPTAQEFGELTANSVEGDMKPGDISGHTLFDQSNTGQPTERIAAASIGAGHAATPHSVYSAADRELVAERENKAAMARTSTASGIAASASMANARLHEQGLNERRWDAPVHSSPGSALFFNPSDKRAPAGVPRDEVFVPVPARPTADKFVQSVDENGRPVWRQAQDGIPAPPQRPTADKFVQSQDPNDPTKNIWIEPQHGAPGPVIKPPTSTDISPNEVADLEFNSLRDIPGALSEDLKSVTPDFRKMYGQKMEGAKAAAALAYQKSRSAADGMKAYREALGIQPGSTFKSGGWFSDPKTVPPAGAPVVAPPVAAPTAPAALPPSAAGQLKEGVETKFGNGQVWIKRGGVPVQVQ